MSLFFSGREILEMALRIENNGKAFYQNALKGLKDPTVKAAYEHLATEEIRHAAQFRALLPSLSSASTPPPEEYADYLRALVDTRLFPDEETARQRALGAKDDMEAIDLGIRMETETILFFSEVKELVRREEAGVVEKILNEEREHVKRLAGLKRELLKLRERRE